MAFDALYGEHEMLISKSKELVKTNKNLELKVAMLEKKVASLCEMPNANKEVDLEKLELKQLLAKSQKENAMLDMTLKKFQSSAKIVDEIIDTQYAREDRGGIGFKNVPTKEYVKIDLKPPTLVDEPSTSCKRLSTSFKKRSKFTCTYCEKGNHISSMCPIRRLCELGTLIPE